MQDGEEAGGRRGRRAGRHEQARLCQGGQLEVPPSLPPSLKISGVKVIFLNVSVTSIEVDEFKGKGSDQHTRPVGSSGFFYELESLQFICILKN